MLKKRKKFRCSKDCTVFFQAMILLQNGTVTQVPVKHFPRIAGESKFNLWNRLLGPLMDCFAFVWMKKKYINYKIQERA